MDKDEKQFILTTSKDIFMQIIEVRTTGAPTVDQVDEYFKQLVKTVEETYKSIDNKTTE